VASAWKRVVAARRATAWRIRRLGRSIARWIRQLGLFAASGLVLLVGLVITAGVWIGLSFLLNHHSPWYVPPGEKPASNLDLTKVALAIVAGVGAAIGLTVTYRRQRDLERGRFDERFAAAAEQLGADSAAQRLAGVYAVGALADQNESRRQQCVDLLCAYVRLPYDPAAGLLRTVVSEHTWPVGAATGKEQRTYERLPNDRDVRLTIIALIKGHLQPEAETSWSKYDYNFSGAVFDDGDFAGAEFSGDVNFNHTTFSGNFDFSKTSFSGRLATFSGATFAGGHVNFSEATFLAFAAFYKAKFRAGAVDFYRATFAGKATFRDAAFFSGVVVNTHSAEFSDNVEFDEAKFAGGRISLDGTLFSGDVTFIETTFSGGDVTLGSTFADSWVTFDGATFDSGSRVTFDGATFDSGSRVTFDGATFDSGSRVTRDGSEFRGYEPPEAP
jgi:uncharacterized protein YjbI with pentapeptide repeats